MLGILATVGFSLLLSTTSLAQDFPFPIDPFPLPVDLFGQPTNVDGLVRIATDGFGDIDNNWAWSMKWFQGKLYVGTGRSVHCVAALAAQSFLGINIYPPIGSGCPPDPTDLPLAAEIWRYTPETDTWERVYQSPEDIPIRFDAAGSPTKFTARDIGFRGMAVFQEPDGTEALYVAGLSSVAVFGPLFDFVGSPPPRLLRTVDGINWEAIPQTPGTFLGNIGVPEPGGITRPEGFRSLVTYKGMLLATVTDFLGMGTIIASFNPAEGDDAWFSLSPPREEFPVTQLHVYNDHLYCSVGSILHGTGYSIFRTDAEEIPPFALVPVVTNDEFEAEGLHPAKAVSLMEFNGRLYAGTNWPTELIRINADDTWDLLIGEPRLTPQGLKTPLSGLSTGLGSIFNGHLRTLAAHDGRLYLGTMDWSPASRLFPILEPMVEHELGFDLFRTDDGIYWTPISKNGLGDPLQYGIESMESTPHGLFVGTTSGFEGTQIWQKENGAEVAILSAPDRLEAVSQGIVGDQVVLSWEPSPGAVRYHIYRSTVESVSAVLSEISMGGFDLEPLCLAVPQLCATLGALEGTLGLPGPFVWVGSTPDLFFVEDPATNLQSIYFVQAEGSEGEISSPSNIAGGPSKAAPVTFTTVETELESAFRLDPENLDARIALRLVRLASRAARGSNLPASQRLLQFAHESLAEEPLLAATAQNGLDLDFLLSRLRRNLSLAEQGLFPVFALL